MIFFRRFLRRHVVDDAPIVDLSHLDNLDGVGRRRAARPTPESVDEATSDVDLFAVARGAGVLAEYPDDHPGWARQSAALIDAVEGDLRARAIAQEQRTSEALLAYQADGDADNAMRVWRGDAA